MGKSTISMIMFNSYVKLPEGKSHLYWIPQKVPGGKQNARRFAPRNQSVAFLERGESPFVMLKQPCFL